MSTQEIYRQDSFDIGKISDTNASWLDEELAGSEFKDKRIAGRFKTICKQLWRGIGNPIPFACQDWANTKAAYRFFSNERVDEEQILKGHLESTKARFSAMNGLVLVIQDTTEFSYEREKIDLVGLRRVIPNQNDLFGNPQRLTKCGILMHSSLAMTTEGLPLGLSAIKFWTRKKFKGCNELKRHINPTRMPIEGKESYRWLENLRYSPQLFGAPERCVHIGDRESDIYELFCMSQDLGSHFLVRTCVDRLAGDGKHTIAKEMEEVHLKGLHRIEVRDKKGKLTEALLEVKYRHIKVLPPIGKQKQYPGLSLTVIHAQERRKPRGRDRIVWKLITDLPIKSSKSAIEKLNWYSLRWRIEVYHKILKSGCGAELSKLSTAERLTKLISIFCILSWRIFWMTMINSFCTHASPGLAFTDSEMILLDNLNKGKRIKKIYMEDYIIQLAKLGGYLGRTSDPPPGNMVMWRGLSRLTDIQLGFNMAMQLVGN